MKHKGIKTALAGAGALAAGLSAVAVAGFRTAVVRRDLTPEQERQHLERGSWRDCLEEIDREMAWFRAQKPEELTIRSRDGLKLCGSYLDAPDAKACMLLCHGYRSRGGLDFALVLRTLYEHGCSVLVIDQRAHGRSEGKYIAYGVLERYDCQQWAWFLHAKLGGRVPIFLEGMSMGASTVMMAAELALPPSVVGIIADCGYNSPWEELRHCIKYRYHLPVFPVLPLTELMCRLVAGYSLKGASAAASLANSPLPLLIIHGMDDDFVPATMTAENYAAAAGEKRQILVPGARHALSYLVDRERLEKELMDFIDSHAEQFHGA